MVFEQLVSAFLVVFLCETCSRHWESSGLSSTAGLRLNVAWFVAPCFPWVDTLLEAAAKCVDALVHVGGGAALLALGGRLLVGFDVAPLAIDFLPLVLENLGPEGIARGVSSGVVTGLDQLRWLVDLGTVNLSPLAVIVRLWLLEAVRTGEVNGTSEESADLFGGLGGGCIVTAASHLTLVLFGDLVEDLAELLRVVEAWLTKSNVDSSALGVITETASSGGDALNTTTMVTDRITTNTSVLRVTTLWVQETLVLGDASLGTASNALGIGRPPVMSLLVGR